MISLRKFGALTVIGAAAGKSPTSREEVNPDNFRNARCEGSPSEASFHNCAPKDIYVISDAE